MGEIDEELPSGSTRSRARHFIGRGLPEVLHPELRLQWRETVPSNGNVVSRLGSSHFPAENISRYEGKLGCNLYHIWQQKRPWNASLRTGNWLRGWIWTNDLQGMNLTRRTKQY